jgi:hypothetical protein
MATPRDPRLFGAAKVLRTAAKVRGAGQIP